MKLFRYIPSGDVLITTYGSHGAIINHLARHYRDAHVVCIALEAGGVLARHAASGDQLFMVIAGHGEVSGDDGRWLPISAGTAAIWRSAEMHETRAGADGLTAIVIEGALEDPSVSEG
jgi:quercetin dioxygenase-like cupin family protein